MYFLVLSPDLRQQNLTYPFTSLHHHFVFSPSLLFSSLPPKGHQKCSVKEHIHTVLKLAQMPDF